MESFQLPPTVDCAPKRCFCGRKTVASHDFWFCSTECARRDALRSLNNPECHYRRIVQSNVGTGPESRRMGFVRSPTGDLPLPQVPARDVYNQGYALHGAGSPAQTWTTGEVQTRNTRGELLVSRTDMTGWNTHAPMVPIRIPDHPYARVPTTQSVGHAENDAANAGRSRKARDGEERGVYQIHADIVPPMRKESLPHHRGVSSHAEPAIGTQALRRSASRNWWDEPTQPHGGPDPVRHVVGKLREGASENFEPRSFFDMEDDY